MHLADETATVALARALERTREGRAVVFLHGELGAGKSTLARAWLRACGVEGAIRSPTYTLVEHYPLAAGGNALHLDLYRIGAAGDARIDGVADRENFRAALARRFDGRERVGGFA